MVFPSGSSSLKCRALISSLMNMEFALESELVLEKEDLDYLKTFYGTVATGEPKAYSSDGLYYNIFPVPDGLYIIRNKYYQKDVAINTLTLSDTCLWLTHASDCVIGWAGRMLATSYRDQAAMAQFNMMEKEGRMLLDNQNESRKHINRTYQVGGPE